MSLWGFVKDEALSLSWLKDESSLELDDELRLVRSTSRGGILVEGIQGGEGGRGGKKPPNRGQRLLA